MVQAGKEGRIYLMDRDNLGGYNSSSDNIVQEIPVNPSTSFSISGLWSIPAYWNGNLYFWGNSDKLTAFSFASGKTRRDHFVILRKLRFSRSHALDFLQWKHQRHRLGRVDQRVRFERRGSTAGA